MQLKVAGTKRFGHVCCCGSWKGPAIADSEVRD